MDVSRQLLVRFGVQRDPTQCRQRWLKVQDPHIKKGAWDPSEDRLLSLAVTDMIRQIGGTKGMNWSEVAEMVRGRTGKACRERW